MGPLPTYTIPYNRIDQSFSPQRIESLHLSEILPPFLLETPCWLSFHKVSHTHSLMLQHYLFCMPPRYLSHIFADPVRTYVFQPMLNKLISTSEAAFMDQLVGLQNWTETIRNEMEILCALLWNTPTVHIQWLIMEKALVESIFECMQTSNNEWLLDDGKSHILSLILLLTHNSPMAKWSQNSNWQCCLHEWGCLSTSWDITSI